MKCHKCNQDSIKIDNGHIICDICGLDINVSLNLEEDNFFDLFFYNKNLDEAYQLGKEAYQNSVKVDANPYNNNSDQIAMNRKWDDGWQSENIVCEAAGLTFLAEKLKEQIDNLIKGQIELIKEKNEILTLYEIIQKQISSLFNKKYWFGYSYGKDLSTIINGHQLKTTEYIPLENLDD